MTPFPFSYYTRPVIFAGLCLGFLLLVAASISSPLAAQDNSEKLAAIKHFEGLNGFVGLDSERSGEPVWMVDLTDATITDDQLKALGAFPELEVLILNDTAITDQGLAYVANNSKLTKLMLAGTKITNAGLKHLKSLSELKELNLVETSITDQGLLQLAGLSKLEPPIVFNSKVTETGLKAWQLAQRNFDPTATPETRPANIDVPKLSGPVTAGTFTSLVREGEDRTAAAYFQMGTEFFLAMRRDPIGSQQAVILLEKAVALAPDNTDYQLGLADAYVHLDNEVTLALSTDIYERLLDKNPHDRRLLARLTEAYMLLGNAEVAMQFAGRHLESVGGKDVYPVALQFVVASLEARRHQRGVQVLEQTCRRFPQQLAVRLLLATVRIESGDHETAKNEIRQVIQSLPAGHALVKVGQQMIERIEP